jgi:uncharacterized membrane protein (DUF2068 family)
MTTSSHGGRFVFLIALERTIRGVLLIAGGIYLTIHTGHDISKLAYDLVRSFDLDPDRPFFKHTLDRLSRLHGHEVAVFGAGAIAYGALELVEGVGLFKRKRWAEWLTVIATSLLVPFEVYEVVHKVSVLKAAGLAVNVVVVLYLYRVVRQRGREA